MYSCPIRSGSESARANGSFPQACRAPIPSPHHLQDARRGSAALEHGGRSSGAILRARRPLWAEARRWRSRSPLPALALVQLREDVRLRDSVALSQCLAMGCSIVHGACAGSLYLPCGDCTAEHYTSQAPLGTLPSAHPSFLALCQHDYRLSESTGIVGRL
jgi:hypothetical protein